MEPPSTNAHLQQFFCALQWIRTSLPNVMTSISPLLKSLEIVLERTRKRTKAAESEASLRRVGWINVEENAFHNCRGALAHSYSYSP